MNRYEPTRSLERFFARMDANGFQRRRLRAVKTLFANYILQKFVSYKYYETAHHLLRYLLTDNPDGAVAFIDANRPETGLRWATRFMENDGRVSGRRFPQEEIQALHNAVWTNPRILEEEERLNADVHDLYDDWIRGELTVLLPHFADPEDLDADERTRFETH